MDRVWKAYGKRPYYLRPGSRADAGPAGARRDRTIRTKPAGDRSRRGAVLADPIDFASLRRQGIGFAQAASGEIWTDYNVHDPGVALLEAFCFALTEFAYRADFPVADLLTGEGGGADLRRLALEPPAEVLPTRPVTARDLALALSAADASVERVLVYPLAGVSAGLYDLHVVPAAEADPEAAVAAVRRAFHASRNLCEDIRSLALAVAVPCRLEARIEVRRNHAPERVAALVYDRCRRLMRDRSATATARAATRRDAFDEPARLFGRSVDPDGGAPGFEAFFAALTGLEEVEDVIALAFRRMDAPELDPFAALGPGQYRELVLPQTPGEVGLVLASRDLEIRFDLAGMHDEISRLRADHIARMTDPLDRADWAPLPPGRRRGFGYVPLGHGLPPAYGVGPERLPRSAAPVARAAAGRLRGYLALGDALLAGATADLAGLPDLFAADSFARASYRAVPLDLGPMAELADGRREAMADAVAGFDPWHDRKGRILDYLLALHGEDASQNSLRQHDLYRSQGGRRDAILANRARLLAEVAALNRGRGAGPDLLEGEPAQAVGLGRKLALLLDFPERGDRPLATELAQSGLSLVDGPGPDGGWRVPRATLPLGGDPFAMLVRRIEAPAPVETEVLIAETPFLREGVIGCDVLRRGVLGEAWLAAPHPDGWRVYLDPEADGVLLEAGQFATWMDAVTRANQLRELFVAMNRRSEGVYLVEDVLLRAAGSYTPMTLVAVFAGWSARTGAPEFRHLAEETLALLCPAHLAHRAIWLDRAAMEEFEALDRDWRLASREAVGQGEALARSAVALRGFLAPGSS